MATSAEMSKDSTRLLGQAQFLQGAGSQLRGFQNMATSFSNARWEKAITRRNNQIAENNARRIEAERAFVLSGMRKQASETEKKQRRGLAETRGKFVVRRAMGVGTGDYAKARLAQGENMVQLHRIAAENRIRETDFDFRNRAYDARVKGQNQAIAGARRAQAHMTKGMESLQQGLDFSYLAGVKATMSTGEMGLSDLFPKKAVSPIDPSAPTSEAMKSANTMDISLGKVDINTGKFTEPFKLTPGSSADPLAPSLTHTRRAKRLGLTSQ